MKKIYVDLDGTCCEFKQAIQSLDELMVPGYFATVAPHGHVVSAIKELHDKNKDVEIFVLSHCLNDTFIIDDKNKWIDAYLPFVKTENRILIPYGAPKYQYVSIDSNAILFDDHTPNLIDWIEHGGRGLKCRTPINSIKGVWKGDYIDSEWPDWMIYDHLVSFINQN